MQVLKLSSWDFASTIDDLDIIGFVD